MRETHSPSQPTPEERQAQLLVLQDAAKKIDEMLITTTYEVFPPMRSFAPEYLKAAAAAGQSSPDSSAAHSSPDHQKVLRVKAIGKLAKSLYDMVTSAVQKGEPEKAQDTIAILSAICRLIRKNPAQMSALLDLVSPKWGAESTTPIDEWMMRNTESIKDILVSEETSHPASRNIINNLPRASHWAKQLRNSVQVFQQTGQGEVLEEPLLKTARQAYMISRNAHDRAARRQDSWEVFSEDMSQIFYLISQEVYGATPNPQRAIELARTLERVSLRVYQSDQIREGFVPQIEGAAQKTIRRRILETVDASQRIEEIEQELYNARFPRGNSLTYAISIRDHIKAHPFKSVGFFQKKPKHHEMHAAGRYILEGTDYVPSVSLDWIREKIQQLNANGAKVQLKELPEEKTHDGSIIVTTDGYIVMLDGRLGVKGLHTVWLVTTPVPVQND